MSETIIRIEQDPRMIELLESIDEKLGRLLPDQGAKTYSLQEAADALGVDRQTAREYCRRGELRYRGKGNGTRRTHYVISQEAINDFRARRERGA
jgi:DNA-directed RNA polymerase specialized sigma24 family protein